MTYIESTKKFTDVDNSDRTYSPMVRTGSTSYSKSMVFDPSLGRVSATDNILGAYATYPKVIGYVGPVLNATHTDTSETIDLYTERQIIEWLNGSTASINTWYDQTGNGNHYTESDSSYKPILQLLIHDEASSSQIWIDFDTKGMSNTLSISSGDFGFIGAFVAKYDTGDFARVVGGSNNWLMGPYNNYISYYGGAFAQSTGTLSENEFYVQSAQKTSATNGSSRGNKIYLGTGGSAYPNTLALGTRCIYGTDYARCYMRELVILNVADSDLIEYYEDKVLEKSVGV